MVFSGRTPGRDGRKNDRRVVRVLPNIALTAILQEANGFGKQAMTVLLMKPLTPRCMQSNCKCFKMKLTFPGALSAPHCVSFLGCSVTIWC